jgi:S1 RNA binding domain protein
MDIGSTVEGTIVKLAEYGAIVRLQGGKTGLIHISEIADTFVRDVKDYFKEHDRVRVKILNINNKGRYELSTKNIEQPEQEAPREKKKPAEREPEVVNLGPENGNDLQHGHANVGFEDSLQRYMRDSQERQLDIKRNIEGKRGFRKRV